jgi:hypothetical protein
MRDGDYAGRLQFGDRPIGADTSLEPAPDGVTQTVDENGIPHLGATDPAIAIAAQEAAADEAAAKAAADAAAKAAEVQKPITETGTKIWPLRTPMKTSGRGWRATRIGPRRSRCPTRGRPARRATAGISRREHLSDGRHDRHEHTDPGGGAEQAAVNPSLNWPEWASNFAAAHRPSPMATAADGSVPDQGPLTAFGATSNLGFPSLAPTATPVAAEG